MLYTMNLIVVAYHLFSIAPWVMATVEGLQDDPTTAWFVLFVVQTVLLLAWIWCESVEMVPADTGSRNLRVVAICGHGITLIWIVAVSGSTSIETHMVYTLGSLPQMAMFSVAAAEFTRDYMSSAVKSTLRTRVR